VATALLRKVYGLSKQILPAASADKIDILLQKAQRVLDNQDVEALHRQSFPGSKVMDTGDDFVRQLFGAYYGKYFSNDIVPGKTIAHAQSWVPFYPQSTDVILYNFFGRNYGIRDPIYYRFILISDSKPVRLFTQVLAQDAVWKVDFSRFGEAMTLPPYATVLIQAFHPRIKTLGNQLRYLVLYRNPRHGIQCGVHSMLSSTTGIESMIQPALRSYAPERSKTYYFTPAVSHELMENSPLLPGGTLAQKTIPGKRAGLGYLITEDAEGYPTGVWHDGPTSHRVPLIHPPQKLGPCKTAFSVPNFAVHAPVLFVSGHQIGFSAQLLHFKAFDLKNKLIAEKSLQVKEETCTVDLREVFKTDNLQGLINVEIDYHHDYGEFASLPACFVHIYYRSAHGFGDQVHSLSTFGYSNDVKAKLKSYRCRKFAPLLVEPGLKFLYSVVNVGSAKPNGDTLVKLRVLTDTSGEVVLKLAVPEQGIATISGEELLAALKGDIQKAAIVFLEHETTNFTASYFFINENNTHLGVDHFTGG
jgi:hypothetical protein